MSIKFDQVPSNFVANYRDRLIHAAVGPQEDGILNVPTPATIDLLDRHLEARRQRALWRQENLNNRLAVEVSLI